MLTHGALCSRSLHVFSKHTYRDGGRFLMKRMLMHKASSSDDDASLEERVFAQTFVSDDDDVRLFECAKSLSARDFANLIARHNPDALGRKMKNEPKLRNSGKAKSSFNVALSALVENGRFEEVEKMFSIWREEFPRVDVDVVSVSLVASALRQTREDIADVERFVFEQKSRHLIKRPNKKVARKKINANKYERDGLLPMGVVYEDEDVIAVCKTSGIPSTSDPSTPSVSDFLMSMKKDDPSFSLSEMNGADARGVVHRLDKLTSGVMLLAKNDVTHCELVSAFYRRKTKKVYNAIASGIFEDDEGEIDFPVDNREAYSKYAVLERLERGESSFVEVMPRTGRKHQIRVHLSSIGHPLVNDALYTPKKIRKSDENSTVVKPKSSSFYLHARSLELPHPSDASKMLKLEAPLSASFLAEIDRLR
jgi:23S rRNA pseudouridine1911/1915/1917 synthase